MPYILILIVSLLLITKNRKTTKSGVMNNFTEVDFKAAVLKASQFYTKEKLQIAEKLYRLETAHFSSLQYRRTGSAGMEKHSSIFPYGWTYIKDIWLKYPETAPKGTFEATEKLTGVKKPFLVFASVYAGLIALLLYIDKYGAGRWYSTDSNKQATYLSNVNKMSANIVNSLLT